MQTWPHVAAGKFNTSGEEHAMSTSLSLRGSTLTSRPDAPRLQDAPGLSNPRAPPSLSLYSPPTLSKSLGPPPAPPVPENAGVPAETPASPPDMPSQSAPAPPPLPGALNSMAAQGETLASPLNFGGHPLPGSPQAAAPHAVPALPGPALTGYPHMFPDAMPGLLQQQPEPPPHPLHNLERWGSDVMQQAQQAMMAPLNPLAFMPPQSSRTPASPTSSKHSAAPPVPPPAPAFPQLVPQQLQRLIPQTSASSLLSQGGPAPHQRHGPGRQGAGPGGGGSGQPRLGRLGQARSGSVASSVTSRATLVPLGVPVRDLEAGEDGAGGGGGPTGGAEAEKGRALWQGLTRQRQASETSQQSGYLHTAESEGPGDEGAGRVGAAPEQRRRLDSYRKEKVDGRRGGRDAPGGPEGKGGKSDPEEGDEPDPEPRNGGKEKL